MEMQAALLPGNIMSLLAADYARCFIPARHRCQRAQLRLWYGTTANSNAAVHLQKLDPQKPFRLERIVKQGHQSRDVHAERTLNGCYC